ncbi:MAG TPA: Uma2 family endonuclease [Saprospiraceae bacterium]|nr:Uma2 family endonuclease [Saprospiraceae bacterium]HMQ85913.1 Uma2 family endonuclease [Saprospiraceae bacterium]
MKEDVLVEGSVPTTTFDYETERNKPMPNRIHGVIQTEISALLKAKYSDTYQIPSEVTLDTVPAFTPDICIFPKKQLSWKDMEAREKEMPITTIEILSPSQTIDELIRKAFEVYFPAGVQSAWVVIPPIKTITIISPDEQQHTFSQGEAIDPITGVQVSLEKVFECLV